MASFSGGLFSDLVVIFRPSGDVDCTIPTCGYSEYWVTSSSAVTFSNENLTITNTGTTSPDQGARVEIGLYAGKYYFEVTFTIATAASPNMGIGIGDGCSTFTSMGTDGTNGVYLKKAGTVHSNGVTSGVALGAIVSADRISVAVDLDNRMIWFRKNTGNWNNNASYDPATNVGGIPLPDGQMQPISCFGGTGGGTGNALTINLGTTGTLVGTVPAGFSAGWHPEGYLERFLDRTSGLDATHIAAYTELIDGLSLDGLICKFDVLHVYATQDSATALLNLVQEPYNGIDNGSPAFAADCGFIGVDGSTTVYIDTVFNPVEAHALSLPPAFDQDYAHISAFVLTDEAGQAGSVIGNANTSGQGSQIIPRYTDDEIYFKTNSQSTAGVTNITTIGHYTSSRIGPTSFVGYKNGAAMFSDATASVAMLDNRFHALSNNTLGGSPVGHSGLIAAVSIGSGLTPAEQCRFYGRMYDYLANIDVDPFYANTKLLLSGDGADGSTTFTDQSAVARGNATVSGNAQIDTAQFKFGTGSLLLDGAGDRISFPDSADWTLDGPFTIECWLRISSFSAATNTIAMHGTSSINYGWFFSYSNSGTLRFRFDENGDGVSSHDLNSSAYPYIMAFDTWYHCAVARDSNNTMRLFINGVMTDSKAAATGTSYNSTDVLHIGMASSGGALPMNGWLDEVRITKGVSRYSCDGGFRVPAAAFPRSTCSHCGTFATDTWSTTDKLNTTLSLGNLRATLSGAGGVRANASYSTGKYYFELTYTTIGSNPSTGLALATADLDGSPGTGIVSVIRFTGAITVNGVASGSAIGIISGSSAVGIAVDLDANLIWFRKQGSASWNGSGTANPATGVGGVDISSVSTGPLYPMFFGTNADAITANFGASVFNQAVPYGYVCGWPAP